jgi:hypothetical protein
MLFAFLPFIFPAFYRRRENENASPQQSAGAFNRSASLHTEEKISGMGKKERKNEIATLEFSLKIDFTLTCTLVDAEEENKTLC